MSIYSTPAMVCQAARAGFVGKKNTQDTELRIVPCTFNHCLQNYAAPDPNVVFIGAPRLKTHGFVTKHNFGCKKSVFKF
jgi:hypothetical protein